MVSSTLPGSFLLLFGAEDYLLDQRVEEKTRGAETEPIRLQGSDLTEQDFVGLLQSPRFGQEIRTVILDEAEHIKITGKPWATYDFTNHREDVVLVFRTSKAPETWLKHLQGKVVLEEHAKLKPWGTPSPIQTWVTQQAKSLDLDISETLIRKLIAWVGSDLYPLSSELIKLKRLAAQGPATLEMLKSVVTPRLPSDPFGVAEAALAKDPVKALTLLDRVIRHHGEESLVPIVAGLMKQTEQLVTARHLHDQGRSVEAIAETLAMHPYRYKAGLHPYVLRHQLKNLVPVLVRLGRLDRDVKSSAPAKKARVELAVLTLAR